MLEFLEPGPLDFLHSNLCACRALNESSELPTLALL